MERGGSQMHTIRARPVGRCGLLIALRRRGARRAGDRGPARRGRASDTLVPRDRRPRSHARDVHQGRQRRPAVRGPTAPAGRSSPSPAATGAADWASFGDYEIQTIQGERYAFDAGDPSRNYWAFWLNAATRQLGICDARDAGGRRGPVFPTASARAAPGARRRCASPVPAPRSRAGPSPCASSSTASPSTRTSTPTTTRRRPRARRYAAGRRHHRRRRRAPPSPRPPQRDRTLQGDQGRRDTSRSAHDERRASSCRGRPRAARRRRSSTPRPPRSAGSVRRGAVYARRRAPRLLRGSVAADPSGLRSVKLRLTRRSAQRCAYFSGRRERFRDDALRRTRRCSRSATARLVLPAARAARPRPLRARGQGDRPARSTAATARRACRFRVR